MKFVCEFSFIKRGKIPWRANAYVFIIKQGEVIDCFQENNRYLRSADRFELGS